MSQAVLDSLNSSLSSRSSNESSGDYEFIQGARLLAQHKYQNLSDKGRYELVYERFDL